MGSGGLRFPLEISVTKTHMLIMQGISHLIILECAGKESEVRCNCHVVLIVSGTGSDHSDRGKGTKEEYEEMGDQLSTRRNGEAQLNLRNTHGCLPLGQT